jgi:DNA-binding NarL/FixJ family response regulator
MRSGLVLVDDHAVYRSLARALLEREGFEVLGEAYDGDSAVERLAALSSPPVVVLISSRSVRELQHRLASSPAAGFVAKDQLSAATLAEVVG